MTRCLPPLMLLLAGLLTAPGWAQDNAKPAEVEQAALFKKFEETLSGADLVGRFSMTGREDGALKEESYHINSVTKLDDGDYWLFNVQMKYGDKEVALPMPLEVKWAGETPVITLDKTTLPGLGTFSARVVIDEDKYAGTWSHDEKGGHLLGKIEKKAPDAEEPAAEEPAAEGSE